MAAFAAGDLFEAKEAWYTSWRVQRADMASRSPPRSDRRDPRDVCRPAVLFEWGTCRPSNEGARSDRFNERTRVFFGAASWRRAARPYSKGEWSHRRIFPSALCSWRHHALAGSSAC